MIACFLFRHVGLAVERTRAENLWGEPFALCAADSTLQVVSDEAGRFGVCAGQNSSSARALCPSLIVLPYDRAAYEAAMGTVWDALAVESSVVEPVGPEIAYVEFSGLFIFERARDLGEELAARIRIPVQIGLARSKMTAHHAALRSHNNNVVVVPAGMEADFLAHVSITAVPQVEAKLYRSLQHLGVHTLGDLHRLPTRELQRQFKTKGVWLQRLAHGEDGDRVRALWPPHRVRCRVNFEYEVNSVTAVEHAIQECANTIAASLVREREFARSLTLRLRLGDDSYIQDEARLHTPVDTEAGVYRVAVRLLRKLSIKQAVMGLEIEAGDLGIGVGIQMALFDLNESGSGYPHERKRRLEETFSYLRGRFGIAAVVPLRLLSQARRIHLWTYPLGHLLSEPVEVATSRRGTPVRYWRRGLQYEVVGVHDRWRESEAVWHELVESITYRVETNPPPGFYELNKVGNKWRVVGVAD
ncbi:MAG: dinB [Chthonomonadaceae bacterium]|nr:dinB [Chthonomonadaceae bacterium]